MTPRERASLADQLLSNPLFDEIMSGLEASAIERLVSAPTHETRHEAQLRVHAVRSFRSDCEAALRSTREPKAAPA